MPLKTSLISFSLLLSTCAGVPPKPEVEICALDEPKSECICHIKPPDEDAGEGYRKPLSYCDKATMFRPEEWEKVQNYIDELVDYAKNNCSRGLNADSP